MTSRKMKLKLPHFRIVFMLLLIALFPGAAQAVEQKSAMIEKVWASLEGEPFLTFQRARERFMAGDNEDAGRFVRKGAAFLLLETEHANSAHREELEAAAKGLTSVAGQAESELLLSGKTLEAAFARAHFVMAGHYGDLARQYESLGEPQTSARALDICAGHLLAADYWSPEGLAEEDIAGVRKTRLFLDDAEEGAGDAKMSLGEAFKRLNKSMEKLSKYIRFYEGEQK